MLLWLQLVGKDSMVTSVYKLQLGWIERKLKRGTRL